MHLSCCLIELCVNNNEWVAHHQHHLVAAQAQFQQLPKQSVFLQSLRIGAVPNGHSNASSRDYSSKENRLLSLSSINIQQPGTYRFTMDNIRGSKNCTISLNKYQLHNYPITNLTLQAKTYLNIKVLSQINYEKRQSISYVFHYYCA